MSLGRGSYFIPCRGRLCESEWCRRQWSSVKASKIAGGLKRALERGWFPLFLTLTAPSAPPDDMTWAEWNATVPARFAEFMRAVERETGLKVPYARVLELHRPRPVGRPLHVHAVCADWRYVPLPRLRFLATRYGFGSRVKPERVRSADAVGRYVAARYLAKSHEDLGRRFRVVQFAGDVWREPEDADAATWREVMAALDPALPLPVRPGESMVAWADRMIARGRGTLVFDSAAAFSYVRPPVGGFSVLFPDVDVGEVG